MMMRYALPLLLLFAAYVAADELKADIGASSIAEAAFLRPRADGRSCVPSMPPVLTVDRNPLDCNTTKLEVTCRANSLCVGDFLTVNVDGFEAKGNVDYFPSRKSSAKVDAVATYSTEIPSSLREVYVSCETEVSKYSSFERSVSSPHKPMFSFNGGKRPVFAGSSYKFGCVVINALPDDWLKLSYDDPDFYPGEVVITRISESVIVMAAPTAGAGSWGNKTLTCSTTRSLLASTITVDFKKPSPGTSRSED